MVVRPKDIQAELTNYVMPKAERGMPIVWYPQGITNRNGKLAFVQNATHGRNNIDVFVAGQRVSSFSACPHATDPRLKLGVDQRENGCWDYTEEWKRQEAWRASVDEQLAALKKPAQKKPSTANSK
jgi:hypothetical protein